jgi:hypothetical protein
MASFSSIQNPKFAALPRYVSCVSNILSDCRDAASIPAKEHPAWPLDVPFVCLQAAAHLPQFKKINPNDFDNSPSSGSHLSHCLLIIFDFT